MPITITGKNTGTKYLNEKDGLLYETGKDFGIPYGAKPVSDYGTLYQAVGDRAKDIINRLGGKGEAEAESYGKSILGQPPADMAYWQKQGLNWTPQGLQKDTISRIGEKYGVQSPEQSDKSKYIKQELLRDGIIVGYLPEGGWEAIAYPGDSNYEEEKKKSQPWQPNENNQRNEQDLNKVQSMLDDVATKDNSDISVSKGYTMLDELKKLLTPTNTQSQPSAQSQTANLISQYLTPAENDYNTVKKELTELENTLLNEADKIKGEAVSSTVINKKLVKLDADTSQALRQKQAQVQSAAERVNSQQRIIQLMQNAYQWDYQQAQQNYQFEFNKAVQLFTSIQGFYDKQKDDARADFTTVFNTISKNPEAFKDVNLATKIHWQDIESKAGMPIGTIEGLVKSNPGIEIKWTDTTNIDGKEVRQFWGIKDGKAVLVNQIATGAVITSTIKPPTESQNTLATYTLRLEQSTPIIKELENEISNMNTISYEAQVWIDKPSLQTNTMQKYMQAARNFINATLRRESGAVISPTEFSEARKQYLPQPGDTFDTLKQKEQNRRVVYETFKKGAGGAYQPLDELLTPDYELDGIVYVKGQDGKYYPKK